MVPFTSQFSLLADACDAVMVANADFRLESELQKSLQSLNIPSNAPPESEPKSC